MINVLVGIIHTERLIDGGALSHELYRAPCVGRYVTDSQESEENTTKTQKRSPKTINKNKRWGGGVDIEKRDLEAITVFLFKVRIGYHNSEQLPCNVNIVQDKL